MGFFTSRQKPLATPKLSPLTSKSHLEGEYWLAHMSTHQISLEK